MGITIPSRTTLKMAKVKITTDTSGDGSALLKVPGTPGGSGQGRWVQGGEGWFSNAHEDDHIDIQITDEDNILGAGAGAVISTYTDTDVPTANQGWWVPYDKKGVSIVAIEGTGFVPAGLYIKVIVKKGGAPLEDTFRCNIKWGVNE